MIDLIAASANTSFTDTAISVTFEIVDGSPWTVYRDGVITDARGVHVGSLREVTIVDHEGSSESDAWRLAARREVIGAGR